MATGSFIGTTSNQYITVGITWESTPDTLNNRSTVKATLRARKSASSSAPTTGNGSWKIIINGVETSVSKRVTLNNDNTWVLLGEATVVVDHNADGKKSIQIVVTGGISSTSWSSTSASATVVLDAIPRETTPTFDATTKDIGSSLSITLARADQTFYHRVTYSFHGASGTIGADIGASVVWTIPTGLMSRIPNATSGTLYITVTTYNSAGVEIGTKTASITCAVPASIVPKISGIAVSDTSGAVPGAWGVFVRGKSILHVKATAAGEGGSAIANYSITALGVTRTLNDVDIGVIPDAGTLTVSVTVTDTRGRQATETTNVEVQDYAAPTVERFTVQRVNSTGTPVDNGTYCRVALKAGGASVSGKNTVTARIYHKRSDAGDWTLARTIDVEYAVDATYVIADMVSSRSYAYRVEVQDAFSVSAAENLLPAEGAVIGWMPGGIGVSFGKAAELSYTADFAWKIRGHEGADLDKPLAFMDASAASGTRSNLDVRTRTYTSTAQLGQPAGSATINGCRDAMPDGSQLMAQASDFAPGELPGTIGTVLIGRIHNIRSYCLFMGKEPATGIFKQALDSAGTSFTGTWYRIYDDAMSASAVNGALFAAKSNAHPASDIESLIDKIYPVGAIYTTTNPGNPSALFGGTWAQISGRFLVSAGGEFAAGAQGGASSHKHLTGAGVATNVLGVVNINGNASGGNGKPYVSITGTAGTLPGDIALTYTDDASSLPPYKVVFMWERTA